MSADRVTAAPLVDRATVVQAFRPGLAATSSRYRTLREQGGTSEGWRLTLRQGQRSAGQVRAYSLLNVFAASCMRLGLRDEAENWCRLAGRLESVGQWLIPAEAAVTLARHETLPAAAESAVSLFARLTELVAQTHGSVPGLRLWTAGDGETTHPWWAAAASGKACVERFSVALIDESTPTFLAFPLPSVTVTEAVEPEALKLFDQLMSQATSVEESDTVFKVPGLLEQRLTLEPPRSTVKVPTDLTW